MTPQRFDELRANAYSDDSIPLLSNGDLIECLDEIARLVSMVNATRKILPTDHDCEVNDHNHRVIIAARRAAGGVDGSIARLRRELEDYDAAMADPGEEAEVSP